MVLQNTNGHECIYYHLSDLSLLPRSKLTISLDQCYSKSGTYTSAIAKIIGLLVYDLFSYF